jgi:zinc/manganese transport system ATP-binding protein
MTPLEEATTLSASPEPVTSLAVAPELTSTPAAASSGHGVSTDLDAAQASGADGAAVVLEDVAAGYGATTVLSSLSLEVARGELVGVVGPSGAGKTTLLRLLTGRADRYRGRVEVLGRATRAGRSPAGVGYVPQLEAIDWEFPLTVEQVVLLGDAASSRAVPWFSKRERTGARELLDQLGLGGLYRRRIRELSGGQRQRMFLARALHRRCELLLLDEPTSGVDLATRRDVLAALGELNAGGLTILLTTHDLNFVASHLPRIVCMNGGITADGDPNAVLTPASLARTYGAPMRVLRDGDRTVVVDADDLGLSPRTPRPVHAVDQPGTAEELWP